jgi:hypothetical protein
MAENIRTTLETLEHTQAASDDLRERVTRENYAAFRKHMNELYQRLRTLNTMLLHEDEMALDEFADALSRAFDREPSEYRRASGHE